VITRQIDGLLLSYVSLPGLKVRLDTPQQLVDVARTFGEIGCGCVARIGRRVTRCARTAELR
jgi:hypothetical protein